MQTEENNSLPFVQVTQAMLATCPASFFSNQALRALAQTSQSYHQLASEELRQRAAKTLLTHILKGEQNEAKVMIKTNPHLLTIRSSATDYSGRTIIATPFQAAIGAGDKPMWQMMLPYFDGLEVGEALRQFNEQFPNGIEEDDTAEDLIPHYNAIARAIINDEDLGQSAIKAFREYISAQKEIHQGRHFNFQHIVAAHQAYVDNFDALKNWNNRDLFWQKVVGYAQRQMTTFDAQVHCSGIKSVLDNGDKFVRTLSLANGGQVFPTTDFNRLGFDFALFSYFEWCSGSLAIERGFIHETALIVGIFKELCRAKTDELAGLKESLGHGVRYQP